MRSAIQETNKKTSTPSSSLKHATPIDVVQIQGKYYLAADFSRRFLATSLVGGSASVKVRIVRVDPRWPKVRLSRFVRFNRESVRKWWASETDSYWDWALEHDPTRMQNALRGDTPPPPPPRGGGGGGDTGSTTTRTEGG